MGLIRIFFNNHCKKVYIANKKNSYRNIFEYYVRIFSLKLGDNPIWYGTLSLLMFFNKLICIWLFRAKLEAMIHNIGYPELVVNNTLLHEEIQGVGIVDNTLLHEEIQGVGIVKIHSFMRRYKGWVYLIILSFMWRYKGWV